MRPDANEDSARWHMSIFERKACTEKKCPSPQGQNTRQCPTYGIMLWWPTQLCYIPGQLEWACETVQAEVNGRLPTLLNKKTYGVN